MNLDPKYLNGQIQGYFPSQPRGSFTTISTAHLGGTAHLDQNLGEINRTVPRIALNQFSDELLSSNIDVNGFEVGSAFSDTPFSSRRSTAVDSFDELQVKKAGELANVLLDTKRTFLQENNFIDSGVKFDPGVNDDMDLSRVSRSTFLRAERVKAMLAIKYLTIERIYANANEGHDKYSGIDGVYNPLQIMRNRRIRAKYKEHPKPLSFKTMPLASTVFSSKYSRSTKSKYKLIWAVELNEFIDDSAWRATRIHELKNAKGELWFPKSSKSSLHSSKVKKPHKRPKRTKRLHDKLFIDDDDTEPEKKPDMSSGSVSLKSSRSSKSTDDVRLLPLTDIKHGRRDRLKKKVKKRFGHSESSEDNIDHLRSTDHNLADDSSSIEKDINTDESAKDDGLNNIKIKSVDARKSTADLDDLNIIEPEPPEVVTTSKYEAFENQLKKIDQNQTYLHNSALIKFHFLKQIYPEIFTSTSSKIDFFTTSQIPELRRLMIDINDDTIPAYEQQCSTILNEIKSLTGIINDNYSIKIDNLLTGSDRLTGEINTSLSLEMRKVDERLDKLNESLFGNNLVSKLDINKKSHRMNINDSRNYRTLYFVLENIIVIILRLVWVAVNIYKFGLWVLKMIWKIIRFILF